MRSRFRAGDAIILGLSSSGPAQTIAVSLASLVAACAYGGPMPILLAFVPMLGIALAYQRLNRWSPDSGATFTWVAAVFHPLLGFVAGWMILLYYTLGTSSLTIPAGTYTLALIAPELVDRPLAVALAGGAWNIGVTLLALRGLKVAARFEWLIVVFQYLVLLLLAFFIDPFKQGESVPRPWYGGVGPVSTWVVTVAALLPALWFAHARPGHPIQRWALAIMFLVIGLAFLSGNRTVWIALAAMVMTFAVLAWRDEHRLSQGRALLFLLLGLALLAVLFVVSRQIRFEGVVSDAALPTFEAHDNRIVLWQKAIDMVGERPFAGRGFGREVVESELVARFTEPYYRNLFLQGHNLILNYALQMGVAGIVAILLLFTALAMWFLDLARRVPSARMYAVSGCVLVVGVVAKNMTDDFFINQNALLFWAIAGMLAGVVRQPQPDARTPGNG